MSVRYAIDLLAMLACSVYCTIPLFWLVVHPFIDRWRRRGRRAYALILPIWAVFIAAAFVIMWPFRFGALLHDVGYVGTGGVSVLDWLLHLFGSVQEV